MRVEGKKS
jgi:nucleolar protein 56